MDRFEVGKTYQTRSLCDSDCVISVTISARTANTVIVEGKRFRIAVIEGVESIKPWGSYSMAPIVRATGVVEAPALSIEDRGHEVVLAERTYRREAVEEAVRRIHRPNHYLICEMAPLGVTQ